MISTLQSMDTAIFRFFNAFAGASVFGDATIRFFSAYLLYVMIASVLFFSAATFWGRFRALRQRNIKAILFIAFSAFIARIAIAEPIRFFFSRERPFESLAGVRQLITHPNGASFPSGHASLAFGIAAAAAYYYPKTSIIFFVAALLVGFGRVVAGVHWPSDIIGGAAVGIATAWILHRIWRK